jgi:Glycosyltransferase
MKIALFTETYLDAINGVSTHVKTLRDGLEKLGHEVLVVTADTHCKHHYMSKGVLHCPSVEVKRFYGFGVALPHSRKRLRLIAQFAPDIIHIHHEFGIGLSGITAAKQLGVPLVYTLHTMYDQYIYYIAPRPFLRAATKMSHQYERYIANKADVLTGPSRKCSEYVKRIGVEKEVNVIPNSADLEAFDPAKVSQQQVQGLREKYGIPHGKVMACFVGRLGQEKSVDVLLDYWAAAMKPEDNLHLMIVGEGPDRPALEKRTAKLGIGDMVTFTGLVQHADVPVHLVACDVYVTASLSDTNSISMLEGMATGLPTLQRYDEMNLDQIQPGINGHMFSTAEEFGQQLKEIASHSPEELAEIKKKARQSVVTRGATDLAAYMLQVYQLAKKEQAGYQSDTAADTEEDIYRY